MRRIRYLLPFLLLAGVAGVHAQPIIKITTTGGECDVTPSGGEIFRLDTSGNVLISGTMGTPINTGCPTVGGGTNSPTFNPISAAPIAVSPTSINAGTTTSPTSASVTYNAAYATSCSVSASAGTVSPSGSGTCPTLTLSNTSCTLSGTNCVGNGTASEPTTLGANITKCTYSLTANCGGGVTSSTNLDVVASGGGGDTGNPPGCALNQIGTGTAGQYWSKVLSTTVIYNAGGNNKVGADATSYVDVWSTPGATVPWPGNGGITVRPSASVNMYFAEKFVVPTDGSVTTKPHWSWVGSGTNSNFSMTISSCPGDFGQTGTVITQSYCKVNQSKSSNGLTSMVSSTPVAGYCSLVPGQTYYLNVLPQANLPTSNVSTSSGCGSGCQPYMSMTQ